MNVIDPAAEARKQADELRRKVYPDHYKDEGANTEEGTQQDQSEDQPDQQTDGNATPEDAGRQTDTEPDDGNSSTWEQRYKTLNGKYTSEVPRLQEQIIGLQEQISRLMTQIGEGGTSSQKDEGGGGNKDLADSLADLQEEYGERFVKAIQSIVRAEGEEMVKPVKDKLDNASQQLGQMSFYTELDRVASGWRALNEDKKFLNWLQSSDPVSGIRYHDVLLSHFERGDVAKTAAIFQYYSNNVAASQQQKPQTKAPEHLIAPKKSGGGTQSVVDNNNGDVMTMADYEKLQRDYINGAFKGKEQEFQTKKRAFLKAAQEGRLI